MKYPFIKPDVSQKTIESFKTKIDQIHAAGVYSNNGKFVQELQQYFTEKVGEECVLAANATLIIDAVHHFFVNESMSLPIFTFPATNLARTQRVHFQRTEFADCNDSGIAEHVTSHDVCVTTIPFGDPSANPKRPAKCWKWVVDAAAGLDPDFQLVRRLLEEGADLVIGSLHATKTLSAGEGGVVWGDPDFLRRLRRYQNFGFSGQVNERALCGEGSNHKMNEFSAAFCLSYIEHDFRRSWEERMKTARSYQAFFACRGYQTILSPQAFWFKAKDDAFELCKGLQEDGLDVRRYYHPVVQLPHKTNAAEMSEYGICLPTRAFTEEEIAEIYWILDRRLSR